VKLLVPCSIHLKKYIFVNGQTVHRFGVYPLISDEHPTWLPVSKPKLIGRRKISHLW